MIKALTVCGRAQGRCQHTDDDWREGSVEFNKSAIIGIVQFCERNYFFTGYITIENVIMKSSTLCHFNTH